MSILVQTGYGGSGGDNPSMEYEYTGTSNLTYDVVYNGNIPMIQWRLKLLTSGKLKIKSSTQDIIDVFLVGGGGGSPCGTPSPIGSGGGGGGYVTTQLNHDVKKNTEYDIIIGAGGVGTQYGSAGGKGGTTTAFGLSAEGGYGSYPADNFSVWEGSRTGAGGNGGSGGGTSRRDEDIEGYENNFIGLGIGTTTREFGELDGALYAGGGGGGAQGASYDYYTQPGNGGSNGNNGGVGKLELSSSWQDTGGSGGSGGGGKGGHYSDTSCDGKPNTGGGAGGTNGDAASDGDETHLGHNGGSGIVVIRGRYST